MSWIREVEPKPGEPGLPPVISVMSIDDNAMKAVQNLGQAVTFGGSSLSRVQEEALSTVVSATNRCRY